MLEHGGQLLGGVAMERDEYAFVKGQQSVERLDGKEDDIDGELVLEAMRRAMELHGVESAGEMHPRQVAKIAASMTIIMGQM